MLVERTAELIAAALRGRLAEEVLTEGAQASQRAGDHDGDAQLDQPRHILARDALVHGQADETGDEQVEHGVADDRDVAETEQEAESLVKGRDAQQGLHCAAVPPELDIAFASRFIAGTAASSCWRSASSSDA